MINAPYVVAAVQLPPPVTGLSAVNERVVQELAQRSLIATDIDLSPRAHSGLRKQIFRASRTLAAIVALAKAKPKGARVLYMPSDGGSGIALNIVIAVAAGALGYKIWVHHHSFAYINQRSALMASLIRLAPAGMTHIALCQDMLDGLKARYAKEWGARRNEGLVLPNAFMIAAGSADDTRDDVLTIGHLSNLTAEKGAARFVEIYKALRAANVAVRGRIAGPIGDQASKQAIEEAQAAFPEDFKWLGPLYGADKDQFFASIDAFVFPSDYDNEAQPLVLLEALARGSAVLTTKRGCMSCDHSASPGLVAPIASFQDEAVAWLTQHADKSARRDLPQQAQARFADMKAEAAGQLEKLIEAL